MSDRKSKLAAAALNRNVVTHQLAIIEAMNQQIKRIVNRRHRIGAKPQRVGRTNRSADVSGNPGKQAHHWAMNMPAGDSQRRSHTVTQQRFKLPPIVTDAVIDARNATKKKVMV
jgi:hypothetical protein